MTASSGSGSTPRLDKRLSGVHIQLISSTCKFYQGRRKRKLSSNESPVKTTENHVKRSKKGSVGVRNDFK